MKLRKAILAYGRGNVAPLARLVQKQVYSKGTSKEALIAFVCLSMSMPYSVAKETIERLLSH